MTITQHDKKSYIIHGSIILLLVANLILNALSLNSAEKIEIMKVGGIENYKTLQTIMASDAYKEQYTQNLSLMLEQINGAGAETGFGEETPTEETIAPTTEETGTIVDTNQAQDDNS